MLYDLNCYAEPTFIEKYRKRINVNALINPKFSVRPGVQHSAYARVKVESVRKYLTG
jgi:hypothetical protein